MRGMREWIMIIFFVMILLLVVFILLDDDSAIAQTEPPTEGDWIISDITLKTETSISLNGSIIVLEGGTLTLDNISINFNCEWDGQYGINIHTGGKLNLYDSNIEPDNYQYSFKFEVNGSMDMNNSSVRYLWGGDFSKLDVRIGGIMVFSDDVKILNSTISDTYGDGITCIKSSPTIMYNTIKNAGDDGISCNFSSPKIIGNLIEDNHLGIYIYNDSAPLVLDNNIRRTTYEYFSKGISITHSNRMIIENNTINNFYHGIRIKHSSPYAIYNNSLIDCGLNSLNSSPKISNILIDGAGYGVYCDDYSNVTILDSKIINSGQYDIYLSTNSHSIVTLINTSVDKVFITQGSSIISQWYVHVKVQESSGNIVSNAKIAVKDSNDQVIEPFYFTDATGWAYKIVCTESIQYSNSEIRYTPHTIGAIKNGTGSNSTIEEINGNKWLILILLLDSDGDWIPDIHDTFPNDPLEWLDTDSDGIGDNADNDDDGDGYVDDIEKRENTNPLLNTSYPVDFDHDFNPDSTDSDDDNDGVSDLEDIFPYNSREWSDIDSDGIGDNEDPDDNNNGIPDILEIPLVILIMLIPLFLFYFTNTIAKKKEKSD